jgi:hypothetical protein
MGKPMDITGQRFTHLVALHKDGLTAHRKVLWACQCDCGQRISVIGAHLKNGNTKSCGCKKSGWISEAKFKHGRNPSNDPTYMSWSAMIWRCGHKKRYLERGTKVCPRWASDFSAFLQDMGERPAGTTLDRINNEGHYEPGNCRWAVPAVQSRNTKRNRWFAYAGETLTLTDWATRFGLAPLVVYKRLKRGWDLERALNTPNGRAA